MKGVLWPRRCLGGVKKAQSDVGKLDKHKAVTLLGDEDMERF